ncbi:MAG: hypothetical protein DMF68_00515, partial [Acidobacteria bacterium]
VPTAAVDFLAGVAVPSVVAGRAAASVELPTVVCVVALVVAAQCVAAQHGVAALAPGAAVKSADPVPDARAPSVDPAPGVAAFVSVRPVAVAVAAPDSAEPRVARAPVASFAHAPVAAGSDFAAPVRSDSGSAAVDLDYFSAIDPSAVVAH